MKPSYSYEGQDRIAFSLLRSIKKGNYIDIGANHPILNNNTYLNLFSSICVLYVLFFKVH